MLRSLSLAVLAFLILSAAVPAFAAEPACPDGALAAVFETSGETGEEALFPTQDDPRNDLRNDPRNDPRNKACIFICEAGWGVTTSMKRGTGSDCTAANSNLSSQIGSEAVSIGPSGCSNAGAALGYCGWVLHVTVSCHWDFVLGTYVVDGYGDIKCKDYC